MVGKFTFRGCGGVATVWVNTGGVGGAGREVEKAIPRTQREQGIL